MLPEQLDLLVDGLLGNADEVDTDQLSAVGPEMLGERQDPLHDLSRTSNHQPGRGDSLLKRTTVGEVRVGVVRLVFAPGILRTLTDERCAGDPDYGVLSRPMPMPLEEVTVMLDIRPE